uniref:Uncharacterized protein n=1 Tax=Cucumis melo TaxID=3656 RepID=A0A9I9DZQ0_CUCME
MESSSSNNNDNAKAPRLRLTVNAGDGAQINRRHSRPTVLLRQRRAPAAVVRPTVKTTKKKLGFFPF